MNCVVRLQQDVPPEELVKVTGIHKPRVVPGKLLGSEGIHCNYAESDNLCKFIHLVLITTKIRQFFCFIEPTILIIGIFL